MAGARACRGVERAGLLAGEALLYRGAVIPYGGIGAGRAGLVRPRPRAAGRRGRALGRGARAASPPRRRPTSRRAAHRPRLAHGGAPQRRAGSPWVPRLPGTRATSTTSSTGEALMGLSTLAALNGRWASAARLAGIDGRSRADRCAAMGVRHRDARAGAVGGPRGARRERFAATSRRVGNCQPRTPRTSACRRTRWRASGADPSAPGRVSQTSVGRSGRGSATSTQTPHVGGGRHAGLLSPEV